MAYGEGAADRKRPEAFEIRPNAAQFNFFSGSTVSRSVENQHLIVATGAVVDMQTFERRKSRETLKLERVITVESERA